MFNLLDKLVALSISCQTTTNGSYSPFFPDPIRPHPDNSQLNLTLTQTQALTLPNRTGPDPTGPVQSGQVDQTQPDLDFLTSQLVKRLRRATPRLESRGGSLAGGVGSEVEDLAWSSQVGLGEAGKWVRKLRSGQGRSGCQISVCRPKLNQPNVRHVQTWVS